MAAPQLSDSGISGEWFPTVEESARSNATARRKRFQRLVTYTMVGLTAFAVLGLASFAWRRHTLKADLETLPAAAMAQAAPAAQPAPVAALDRDTASPPPPPVSDAPVAAPAPPPAVAPAPASMQAKSVAKKAPSRSPFLKSVKSQPATIKRR
jgi:hypothetical protein